MVADNVTALAVADALQRATDVMMAPYAQLTPPVWQGCVRVDLPTSAQVKEI